MEKFLVVSGLIFWYATCFAGLCITTGYLVDTVLKRGGVEVGKENKPCGESATG